LTHTMLYRRQAIDTGANNVADNNVHLFCTTKDSERQFYLQTSLFI